MDAPTVTALSGTATSTGHSVERMEPGDIPRDDALIAAKAAAASDPVQALLLRELFEVKSKIAGIRAAAIWTALLLGFFALVLVYFLVGQGQIEVRVSSGF